VARGVKAIVVSNQ